jgi:uncharacterized protein HemX
VRELPNYKEKVASTHSQRPAMVKRQAKASLDYTRVMILLAVVLGIGVLAATIGLSRKRQLQRQDQHDPIQKLASLDSKARSARAGDLAAVTSLTDEILNYFGTPETVRTLSQFKDRMIRAETDYRNKRYKGIHEERSASA